MRLIYLIQIKDNPFFVPRSLDPLFYHQWGIGISKGNWLGNTPFEGLPLYAYFVGVIYKIFGINLFVLRLVQMVLGALSCSFIFVLGKKVFNRKTAVLAGSIAVFYKPFIFYDAMVIGTNLSVFLYTLSLITAVVFFNNYKKRYGFVCGFFIGITVLCRPPILIFPVVMLITFLIEKPRGKIRSFLSGFIFLLIGLFLVLSCVVIRNYAVSKEMILLTSHGGLNFYIGNNPDAAGKFHAPAGIGRQSNKMMGNSKRIAQLELGRELTQSEVSAYWRNKGLDFIKNNPLDFLVLLLKKTYLFFQGGEITDFRSICFFKRYSALLRVALPVFFLIIPWAIYGLIISFSSKGNIALLRNFLFGYIFLIVLYFINSRYRMPVVPVLLLFAALGFFRVIELFFINKKFFYISICAVLSLYFITGIYAEKPSVADDYNELASWYMLEKKDFFKAICLYNEALKLDSDNQYVMFNLGRAYFERKRYSDALRLFKQAVQLDKSDYESYNFIGIILSEQKSYSDAVNFYKKAISINRDYYLAYNNLATVYSVLGKYGLAVCALEQSLIIKP
ncbi:glycosyltransferase family 39 protein, partial [bacterium]|nr:glycosyltransferase family 39 protein [bacterium]